MCAYLRLFPAIRALDQFNIDRYQIICLLTLANNKNNMSNRRDFLKKTTAGALAASPLMKASAQSTDSTQNLIFIYVDDLNDYVGFMDGYKDTHTPNMNALAEQGTVFLNAHTPAPQCNPSRVATLFGVDPTKSGVYNNGVQYNESAYLADKKSIFRHLGESGYNVYAGGKIFHSPWEPHNDVNWDEYYSSPQRNHANLAKTPNGNILDVSEVTHDLNTIYPHDFGAYGTVSDYSDYDVATWAEDKIANAPDGFAIGVGFEKPHHPFVVPKKYFDLYDRNQLIDPSWRADSDIDDLPQSLQNILRNDFFRSDVVPYLQRERKMRDHIHAYLAAISFVDDMIGKVVRAWEKRKENTTIVLLSDHGQFLGEKLQIEKLYLWDRATRVPLVMAGPNIIKNRQSSPMSLLNIYPMLCRIMGVSEPAHLDGIPVNYALSNHISWTQNVRSYYEYPTAPYNGYIAKSLRTDRFRISQWPDGYEFYDYNNDPKEMTNLWPICENCGIFQQLKALL